MAFESAGTMNLTDRNDEEREQKRRHVRRLLRVPATVLPSSAGPAREVRLIDIARAGVAFASVSAMETDEQFVLSFRLFQYDDLIFVQARVVYAAPVENAALYRVGARFADMSDEVAARIADFITSPIARDTD